MSFTFNWPRFSDQFHYDAIQMLNTALNKGNKPPVIADKIEVVELEMGTQPPELEIRDIGDLTVDQFRGIFRLTYSGDAHLVLKTKVQANPLNHKSPDIDIMSGSRGMLAAKQPLVVPMLLRLSHFKLNSYVVLVVSKQKGITLVFKTDPLQNVDINSTFDSIAVIQKFIQREIEEQLRQMFREDLPGIIHRLSQQWVKAKVEAPYLAKHPQPPPLPKRYTADAMSNPDFSLNGLRPQPLATPNFRRARSSSGVSVASANRRAASTAATAAKSAAESDAHTTDLDNFDPTYGLRPEGLPTKSIFRGFSSLFTPSRGLADLAEESSDIGDYDDEAASASFDMVEWDDPVGGFTPPPSEYDDRGDTTEYETIPAVGGGTVTRPRVYHKAQTPSLQPSTVASPIALSRGISSLDNVSGFFSPRSAPYAASILGVTTPGLISRHPTSFNPYFADFGLGAKPSSPNVFSTLDIPLRSAPPYLRGPRPVTPDSLSTQRSLSHSSGGMSRPALSTPPSSSPEEFSPPFPASPSRRRLSISTSSPPSPTRSSFMTDSPQIILTRNNSIHHLSTLSHSYQTLSPYAREMEHFMVRSGPKRCSSSPANPGTPVAVKAKRKRTYRLGRGPAAASPLPDAESEYGMRRGAEGIPSPLPPSSEFDAEDMDRYFKAYDHDPAPVIGPGTVHPTHVRRRGQDFK